MKTILILADGMRPDALENVPRARKIMEKASCALDARTVMPSVTLPCHMSLFHSVEPSRHGTTTNTYMPQVRPVRGLCEVLAAHDKTSAFFYNWEELRDLARPGSLACSFFCSGGALGYREANRMVAREAMAYISASAPDFAFVYFGSPDAAGHGHGWMGSEYMEAVEHCWELIEQLLEQLPEEYTVFITADHGGHDRCHGLDIPEDMTIPIIALGPDFGPDKKLENANIMDIAPTIVRLMGIAPDKDWEGKSLL